VRSVGILNSVFAGGGPAGLAPLINAARQGQLPALAAKGLAVIERDDVLGAGSLGRYSIGSDTLSDTFLECLQDGAEPRLLALRNHPAAAALQAFSGGAAPLPLVGAFLKSLGDAMREAITASGGKVMLHTNALSASREPDGTWSTRLCGPEGEFQLRSRSLVLATGAVQTRHALRAEKVGGEPLLPLHESKLLLSDEVLSIGGEERVRHLLAGKLGPRVAILGGSHSALAAANLLLYRLPGIAFDPGSVCLMHRRPLRVFYPTASAARAEGYFDFTEDDICPVSGRLYRLAGFRLEARELVMRALGVGDRQGEPRLRLHTLQDSDPVARQLLQEADLVIAAMGYRPRALPLFNEAGQEIILAAGQGTLPLVNDDSRVLDASGQPVPGVFGIGLAAGYVPSGPLGGEPSFRGQTNGLWLWQNGVGASIVKELLQEEAAYAPA
jgi:hypothetical protein